MSDLSSPTPLPPLTSQQWLASILLLGTGFMLSVDFSIFNVAIPQVGSAVGLELSQLPWIVTAYALPAAGFTLLFGRIADLYGRRRLFLIGIAVLGLASAAGGIATNAEVLLGARLFQGLGTAIATPAALALLITSFADDRQRARILGVNGALQAAGFTIGALLGGALVGLLSWRWAFLINVPVAVLILVLTPFALRPSSAPSGVKLDLAGAFTVTLGLLAFAFGVLESNVYAVASGLALIVLFLVIEARTRAPLVDLSILSKPTIKWGNVASLVLFSSISSLNFMLTLYLQDVLRLEPLATGLVFTAPGVAAVVGGIVAGRLVGRYGYRAVLGLGLAGQAVFATPLALLGAENLWLWLVVPALFLTFFLHVIALVATVATATSGVADTEQGLATGLFSMSQQIGITIGIPILSAIAATGSDLLSGIQLAIGINLAAVALTAIVTWIGLRSRAIGLSARTG
jgi:MFS family permease